MTQAVDSIVNGKTPAFPNGNGHANPVEGTSNRLQVIDDQKNFTYVLFSMIFIRADEQLLGKSSHHKLSGGVCETRVLTTISSPSLVPNQQERVRVHCSRNGSKY